MKKQPQVTEQTRANLRQAFWELYAEKPVEKISVREITDRAGYNRATFYLYYHDVYELLDEIEDTVLGNIERLVQGRLLQGDRLDFSQHMGLILRLAQRSRDYTRVLLGPHGDPVFSDRLKQIISPLVDRFFLPEAQLDEHCWHRVEGKHMQCRIISFVDSAVERKIKRGELFMDGCGNVSGVVARGDQGLKATSAVVVEIRGIQMKGDEVVCVFCHAHVDAGL